MITLVQFLIVAAVVVIGNIFCYRVGFKRCGQIASNYLDEAIQRGKGSIVKPVKFSAGELNPKLIKEIDRP